MSRRRRSNRRFGSLSAHVASLCCISLIIKSLHLVWSGNLHSKQIELFPFAMWQAFPAADYYGNSASMMDIRVNSLATRNIVGIPSCLPSFMCWTFHALGRLPVAVLVLASRKSMPMPWSDCVLPMTSCEQPTYTLAFRAADLPVQRSIGISPVKPCRRRRHFSPRMRINRFVFLNLPALQPRGPSRRNGFASIPFTCGLRHPAS